MDLTLFVDSVNKLVKLIMSASELDLLASNYMLDLLSHCWAGVDLGDLGMLCESNPLLRAKMCMLCFSVHQFLMRYHRTGFACRGVSTLRFSLAKQLNHTTEEAKLLSFASNQI